MSAILCSPSVYEYDGVTFEIHSYFGPCPLKKDGDPVKRIPRSFWELFERFEALPKAKKEACIVHQGGCQVL